MEKIKITVEISPELKEFIERLAKFLGRDPKKIVQERCERVIECLPHDLAEYLT